MASTLTIAIVGVGSIGSTFAFHLARNGGHDVTAVARLNSARLEQLRRDGAIVDANGERADVRPADALDESTSYDLVIVTLMAHQVDAVLPALQRSRAKCIQFMFNNFEPERLQEAVGVERCSFGMPFVQASLDADGRLKAKVGTAGQKSLIGRQQWVDLFNEAGLPATLEQNMPLWLRCHAPVCVAFESISVAGMRRGGGASWAHALVLAHGVHASFDLIRRLGYTIYPKAKKRMADTPTVVLALALWAMSRIRSFRELLATGKAECCALVDTMTAAASRTDPPILTARIQAMKP